MKNILYKIIRDVDKYLLKETGVYQIRNKNSGKVYIGSTSVGFSKRLTSHIRELIQNRHHSKHLQNCFNQNLNFEDFEISILEVCSPDKCIEREQIYLDLYKSYDDKFGYNISPTAASCLGIKKSKDEKIIIFERMRELTDEQIIKIFNLRNELGLNNQEISKIIGISKNQVASILTRCEKYKYVKEKYNLKLEIKHEKKFNKEDILKIHDLYENKKMSIRDISKLTGFEIIPLRHVIYNENIYKDEKDGLVFNVEKNRKSKTKINRKRGIEINKIIIKEETIKDVFELKHLLDFSNEKISDKLQISLKEVDLILSFRYQRRKYNQIYLEIKTKYSLRQRKNILTEENIINIFADYNSGLYLIDELSKKYNYNNIGLLLLNDETLSKYYRDIILNNNLIVYKPLTKNNEIKSKLMIDRNKKRSKNYKLTDPFGVEFFIKNLSEFCLYRDLDPGNLSRVSKNGKKHKGWSCICLD